MNLSELKPVEPLGSVFPDGTLYTPVGTIATKNSNDIHYKINGIGIHDIYPYPDFCRGGCPVVEILSPDHRRLGNVGKLYATGEMLYGCSVEIMYDLKNSENFVRVNVSSFSKDVFENVVPTSFPLYLRIRKVVDPNEQPKRKEVTVIDLSKPDPASPAIEAFFERMDIVSKAFDEKNGELEEKISQAGELVPEHVVEFAREQAYEMAADASDAADIEAAMIAMFVLGVFIGTGEDFQGNKLW